MTARNYASSKEKTLHSCEDPTSCGVPQKWQDHCHTYEAVLAIQAGRAEITALIEPLVDRVLKGYAKANPGMSQEQVAALAKNAQRAASAWVGRIAGGAEDLFTPWVVSRIQDTAAEPIARITAPDMQPLAPKCRHKRCSAPKSSEAPCRVHILATQVRDLESMLVTYYHARIKEAQNKALRRIVLTSMEKAELASYANEAFLSLVRSYNTDKLAPFQGYLREYMHKRIEDIILSSKPMARPLRDYDLATKRHLEANPDLKTRQRAAEDLGIPAGRIHDLETVRGIISNSSLDHLLDGDQDSVGGYEQNLTPLNTSIDPQPGIGQDNPMQAALDAVLQQLPAEQVELFRAHAEGSLSEHLKALADSGSQMRAAKMEANRLYEQVTARARQLLDEMVDSGFEDGEPELSQIDVPALIESGLRTIRPSDLHRMLLSGELRTWAMDRDLPVRETARIADVLLSRCRAAARAGR